MEHLYITYSSYETSYHSFLLELDRRRRYRDTAEEITRRMQQQLDAMRQGMSAFTQARLSMLTRLEEEMQARKAFDETHVPHLPDELCLHVGSHGHPTKWAVAPAQDETLEELPEIDGDLLAEVSTLSHACQPKAHLSSHDRLQDIST